MDERGETNRKIQRQKIKKHLPGSTYIRRHPFNIWGNGRTEAVDEPGRKLKQQYEDNLKQGNQSEMVDNQSKRGNIG